MNDAMEAVMVLVMIAVIVVVSFLCGHGGLNENT